MSEPRARVKICGVTRIEDALRAADLGAEQIGLNFWPRSPRFVDTARAASIAEAVRGRGGQVALVGVFVREVPERMVAIDRAVGLDLLQFHGDEEPAALAPFGNRALKALRWTRRPEAQFFASYGSAWGFLLDCHAGAAAPPGGTGQSWDYAEAADLPTEKPVLLAGGIGPGNVRAAMAAARPWGVDVCSRIESAPGVKDPGLLAELFREVRHAEARTA